MDSEEKSIARRLVIRISEGDHDAETELVQRYSRGLLILLAKRCGDTMLAEDLHQECFTSVLRRLRAKCLNEPDKLARYIQRTGTNLLIGHNRKQERRRTHCDSEGLENAADNSGNPADAVGREEVARITRQLLGELTVERDRVVLTRFYLDQDDKTSICADLDLSSEHFNRVLHRARGRFRQLLEGGETPHYLRVVQ